MYDILSLNLDQSTILEGLAGLDSNRSSFVKILSNYYDQIVLF